MKTIFRIFGIAVLQAILGSLAIAGACDPYMGYIENNDGTITDPRTNLVWRQCAIGQVWRGTCAGSTKKLTYTEAIRHALADRTGGFDDWRIPERTEVSSIINGFPFADSSAEQFIAKRIEAETNRILPLDEASGGVIYNGAFSWRCDQEKGMPIGTPIDSRIGNPDADGKGIYGGGMRVWVAENPAANGNNAVVSMLEITHFRVGYWVELGLDTQKRHKTNSLLLVRGGTPAGYFAKSVALDADLRMRDEAEQKEIGLRQRQQQIKEEEETLRKQIRQKKEEAQRIEQLAVFRKSLKVGYETNCGPVLELRANLVKVYFPVLSYGNEHWIDANRLYKPHAGCRFVNGRYVGPN